MLQNVRAEVGFKRVYDIFTVASTCTAFENYSVSIIELPQTKELIGQTPSMWGPLWALLVELEDKKEMQEGSRRN